MKPKNYLRLCLLIILSSFSTVQAQILPCNPPSGLSTNAITQTSATASWNTVSGAVLYNLRYRLQSPPGNTWTLVTTQIGSINLANLLCNSVYEWQIQSGCPGINGGIVTSNFTSSLLFTTLSCTNACPVPTGLYANNITNTSAKLHWGSTGATNYRVRYRQIGTTTWTSKYPTANNVVLNGLLPSSLYEWQVRSKCQDPSGVVLSSWSSLSNFQTTGANTCSTPSGLTSINAGAINSKILQWGSTGASSYNIRYRPANTVNWITAMSNTNTKTISGLQQNVSYEWQVQSVCAVNGVITYSAWSASAFFTNPSPLDISPNPASDQLLLRFDTRQEQAITVTIHDFQGMPIQVQTNKAFEGSNEYKLDVTNLKNGFYYLVVDGPEGRSANRFYISK